MKHIDEMISEGMQKFLVNRKAVDAPPDGMSIIVFDDRTSSDECGIESFNHYQQGGFRVCEIVFDMPFEEVKKSIIGDVMHHSGKAGFIVKRHKKIIFTGRGIESYECIDSSDDWCRVVMTVKYSSA